MPAEPSRSDDGSDSKSHLARDLFLTVAVPAIGFVNAVADTHAAPNIQADSTPAITQPRDVPPEPLAIMPEVEQLSDLERLRQERREQEARELPYDLRAPDQVEDRRRDDRER